ncbi:MAG: Rnf-Nqr domain containing protein, partial [Eubacteriales bacterium]|nr:Rnf-Nqr domain containing protein [Eubacteriales bacterium]
MPANSNLKEFTKGIIKENPALVLLLGTCPTLAISSSAVDSLGMGIAAALVLICSNAVISALKKFIPDSVRIPAFITVIA